MILSGIVVSSVLSAGVTLFKALADERVSSIVLWLMGSFSGATMKDAGAAWAGAALLLGAGLWWGRSSTPSPLVKPGRLPGVNEAG